MLMSWTPRITSPTPRPTTIDDHPPRPPRPRPRRSGRHPLPGREAMPGAVEAVVAAAEKGVRTVYVTNNASRARPTSPPTWRSWLPGRGRRRRHQLAGGGGTAGRAAAGGAKVLVVGTAALAAEITGGRADAGRSRRRAPRPSSRASPRLRYATPGGGLRRAAGRGGLGGVNVDPTLPSERGPLPGNGRLVAVAADRDRLAAQVAGKPAPALMQTADRVGAPRRSCRGRALHRHPGWPGRRAWRRCSCSPGAATPRICWPPRRTPARTTSARTSVPHDTTPDELAPVPAARLDGRGGRARRPHALRRRRSARRPARVVRPRTGPRAAGPPGSPPTGTGPPALRALGLASG